MKELSIYNPIPSSLVSSYQSYKNYVFSLPTLSEEDESKLLYKFKISNCVDSAQKLIVSQLRTVINVAQQYKGYGLPEEDLVQEGNIGLMKAVKNFDINHNVRLYTYALIWIKSEIQSYIIKNWKIVKIATTNNFKKLFFNFKSLQKELMNLGVPKENLIKEIANKLKVDQDEVIEIKNYFKSEDVPMLTLNPMDDKDDNNFFEIPSEESENPAFIYEEQHDTPIINKRLHDALNQLKPIAREVINLRYFCDNKLTHKEIATQLNLSTQRVQQIEQESLKKLQKFFI